MNGISVHATNGTKAFGIIAFVGAILLMGGVIACFFGYRLFRTVLAIIGFGLGALMATSVFGISNATMLVAAGVVGGLIGAFILIAAYFVGVALAGASIGAVVANVLFSIGGRDPRVIVVIFLAIAGAVAATYLQRYFIIVKIGQEAELSLCDASHGVGHHAGVLLSFSSMLRR